MEAATVTDARAYANASLELQPRRAPVDAELRQLGSLLVVLDGALLRTVGVQRRTGAELLGPGHPFSLVVNGPMRATHKVVAPTRVAKLDPARLARNPVAIATILDGASQRATGIAGQVIGFQFPSLDDRLSIVLTDIAQRFGVVTPDGVVLPAFLSHTVLAAMTGARRPSLTSAVVRLTEAGKLRRLPDRRWAIRHDFLSF